MKRMLLTGLVLMFSEPAFAQEMIDVYGPVTVNSVQHVWIFLAVFISMILLFGLIYFRQKGNRKKQAIISPKQQAIEALDDLSKYNGEDREAAVRISLIVRHFLEGLYAVKAVEMTTEELAEYFQHHLNVNQNVKELLIPLLLDCDEIKFSAKKINLEHMNQLIENARKFIESAQDQRE